MATYALVDCNNFYVSCERIFNPALRNIPVAVLSSNDGVIVARSNEVKKLGIPMGTPVFKIRDQLTKNKVKCLSSNYALYADISARVMQTLATFSPAVEIYSIDEAFLSFTDFVEKDWTKLGQKIRDTIYKDIGIPVSIGFAPSKTLAKLACHFGKKNPDYNGVLSFIDLQEKEIDTLLQSTEVKEVWGVGWKTAPKLNEIGITTPYDLKKASPTQLRHHFNVVMQRTILELNGEDCLEMELVHEPQKNILCSRSFGRPVSTYPAIRSAVATHVSSASQRLRESSQKANMITVFINTNRHKKWEGYYNNGITVKLPYPTSSTPALTKAALEGLKKIYLPGYMYKKCGVLLTGLIPNSVEQFRLEPDFATKNEKDEKLMKVIDMIDYRYGKKGIKLAVEESVAKDEWASKCEYRSKGFTTSWSELLVV